MKHFNVPILGFSKYRLDLVTQEIVNGRGKVMRVRPDNRGTMITNLVDDDGKQRTVVLDNIIHKTLSSLNNWEPSEVILRDVLASYYNRLKDGIREKRLFDVAVLIKQDVPDAQLSEIGRIITVIRG